jgi:hypothetical protein
MSRTKPQQASFPWRGSVGTFEFPTLMTACGCPGPQFFVQFWKQKKASLKRLAFKDQKEKSPIERLFSMAQISEGTNVPQGSLRLFALRTVRHRGSEHPCWSRTASDNCSLCPGGSRAGSEWSSATPTPSGQRPRPDGRSWRPSGGGRDQPYADIDALRRCRYSAVPEGIGTGDAPLN